MRREVEVRPGAVVKAEFGEFVEWVPEDEAEFFGLYVQQEDGTFHWQEDVSCKDTALTRALLLAAQISTKDVGYDVVYRTDEEEKLITVDRN